MAIKTDVNKVLVEQMFQIYSTAEQQMLEKVVKRIKKGVTDVGWNESKLGETTSLRQELGSLLSNNNKIAKAKLSEGIIDAYSKGKASVNKDLKIAESVMSDIIPAHLQRWILESNNLIDNTQFQILRNVDDIYRKTIAEAGTMVMAGTETRLQASQQALNKFAAAGITGFIDKAGRNWELASYVEMATRTGLSRAALQGHVDRMVELGEDLMRVSSISTTCPICAPWQGKVLSISGKDTQYASLESAKAGGLFHPNCKHTLTMFIPELDQEATSVSNNEWLYQKTQEQRYNERKIREYKRVEAVAMDQTAKLKAQAKIKYWQERQRSLISNTGLKRQYGREGLRGRIGKAELVRADIFNGLPKAPVAKPVKPKQSMYEKFKANSKIDDFDSIDTHFKNILDSPNKIEISDLLKYDINTKDANIYHEEKVNLDKVTSMKSFFELNEFDKYKNITNAELKALEEKVRIIKYKDEYIIVGGRTEAEMLKAVGFKNIIAQLYDATPMKVKVVKQPIIKAKKASSKGIASGDVIEYEKYENVWDSIKGDGWRTGIGVENKHLNVKRDSELFVKYLEDDMSVKAKASERVRQYTGGSYSSYNDKMRSGKHSVIVDELDEILNNGPGLMQDTLLYRHNGINSVKHLMGEEAKAYAVDIVREYSRKKVKTQKAEDLLLEMKQKFLRTTFHDKAILSTSYKPDVFTKYDGMEIQIYAEKGFTKGMFVEGISQHEGEREFIFGREQEFRIYDIDVGTIADGSDNIIFKVKPI